MTEPVPIRNRLPSRMDLFATNLKQDIRAHQRTYEGAYTRTAIGCLSFSILIIKLFSKEFLPIGTIYTIYGCLLYFQRGTPGEGAAVRQKDNAAEPLKGYGNVHN